MAEASALATRLATEPESPAAYARLARSIDADAGTLHPVRVAVLATFTADVIRPYLVVEGARRGLRIEPYIAGFDQIEQEALEPASGLYGGAPDVILLAPRLEEWAPALVHGFAALTKADVEGHVETVVRRLTAIVEAIRRHSRAAILVASFAEPARLACGLADAMLDVSQAAAVAAANDGVARLCRATSGAYVFDYARIVREHGLARWSDAKLWYLGRIPFGADGQRETGRRLARYVRAVVRPACKCLVVDLDNTLWGGVLGEDGLGGISLGDDYPGNVFKDFQRVLATLRDRGVLLAIASKNNEADVAEVFEKHAELVLRDKDFAARQVNWDDKATNLQRIAEELNIGTDALAFFDDNPAERDWVRAQMPEVTVIDVPASPLGYVEALESSGAFDHLVVSAEDRRRAAMYAVEHERKQLRARFASVDEFLADLRIVVTLGLVSEATRPRVAQLIAKTNQFNLTSRRLSAADVQALADAGGIVVWARAADRFGDHGLIAAALARPGDDGSFLLEAFVMSCRVIGRKIETALLAEVMRAARERGATAFVGEYVATPKSRPAADFFARHAFEPAGPEGVWRWDFARGVPAVPDVVRVEWASA
jgi:FkbH-like protein